MNVTRFYNENVEVFVRCRPINELEQNLPVPVEVHPELNKIIMRDIGTNKETSKTFSFDKVFGPDTEQEVIFENVAAPLLPEVIKGFNCTILAYGPTGTGKTFTIEGNKSAMIDGELMNPSAGIIPRCLKKLLTQIQSKEAALQGSSENKISYKISVSYLELYNEEIYDLLSKYEEFVKLKLFDSASPNGSVIIQGLNICEVDSMNKVYKILNKGNKKRRKAATFLNNVSSRSHTVFTVTVSTMEENDAMMSTKTGKLHLVDLAGSENVSRSGAVEKQAREAGNINQSLLALGRVITALGDNASHIPYRGSKLTRLLRDSLGGQTKTKIIATIAPSVYHQEDTLSTLEYALRAKNITNKPEINSEVSTSVLMKDYLEKLWLLREEIRETARSSKFTVDPEALHERETILEIKEAKKDEQLGLKEDLLKESKKLDEAVSIEQAMLLSTEQEYKNLMKNLDETSAKLVVMHQEVKLEEKMLLILEHKFDTKHDKLHEIQKLKEDTSNEVTQLREKVTSALNKRRMLQGNLNNLRSVRSELFRALRKFQQFFSTSMVRMRENAMSTNGEFQGCLSNLESGIACLLKITEGFSHIISVFADIRNTRNTFQDTFKCILQDEENQMQGHLTEICSDVTALDVRSFDSLYSATNTCEANLKNIFGTLDSYCEDFQNEVDSKKDSLKTYIERETSLLQSVTDFCKDFSLSQVNLQEYGIIISDIQAQENMLSEMWGKQITEAEETMHTLKSTFQRAIENNIKMAHSANKKFDKFVTDEKNKIKHVREFCQSSILSAEGFTSAMVFLFEEKVDDRIKEMQSITENASCNYKNLRKNFTRHVHELKSLENLCSKVGNAVLQEKSRRKDLMGAIKCVQIFNQYLYEKQEKIDTFFEAHKNEVATLKGKQTDIHTIVEESLQLFHEKFTEDLSSVISSQDTAIVTSLLKNANVLDVDENSNSIHSENRQLEETNYVEGRQAAQVSTCTLTEDLSIFGGVQCCAFCDKRNDVFVQDQMDSASNKTLQARDYNTPKRERRNKLMLTEETMKLCRDMLESTRSDESENDGI